VEDAATGVGHGESPVRHSLRRPLQAGMMNPARTRKFWQSRTPSKARDESSQKLQQIYRNRPTRKNRSF
jgi:DNA-binding transcriptional regulator PaaX